jgi:hypothetical protein
MSVQRTSLRLLFGSIVGSHYSTRGCLWDFTCHQKDVRIASLLGFLCDTCASQLKATIPNTEFEDINLLISNKWLGSKDDEATPSGVLSRIYSYDLSRSLGLRPEFLGAFRESLTSESAKLIGEIIKWVVILSLSLFLASHFPIFKEFIKK